MADYSPTVRKATDEEIMSAFQQGDAAAFNVIVGRYKDRLVNFVFRYVGDYDDADDIVQETFVRVYRSRDLYQPVASSRHGCIQLRRTWPRRNCGGASTAC